MSSYQANSNEIVELAMRTRHGDCEALEELFGKVYERLVRLSRKMLRQGPFAVQRWEQTEDLAHAAWIRIQRALLDQKLCFQDDMHFFRLAARHIRFELIDMVRKHTGVQGLAANHQTVTVNKTCNNSRGEHASHNDGERFSAVRDSDPGCMAAWAEFHQIVDTLPEGEKAVVDLLWYQGLSQQQAADLLGVEIRTIKRRWREVKIRMTSQLDWCMINET